MRLIKFLVAVVCLMLSLPAVYAAEQARDYPSRPVRIITGSPGSTSDIVPRFLASKLAGIWGQQIVVDNRPGAGGIIGTEIGAKSAADGYTLTVGHIGTHASPQFLFKKLNYDPVKDFQPITLLSVSGIALAVNASVPANNLNDFITYAKGKPGGVNYGSAGGGTSSQLSGELFNQMTGAKLTHIPYKGAGFALQALIAGEVQAAFLSTTTASAQVKSGRIKALAVLSPKRFSAAPDVPSAPESGLAGIESNVWFGLFAPAGTPKAIVAKINHDVTVALITPEAREALLLQGAEASPMSPDQFAAFLRKEIDKWGKVIKEAGMRAE